MCFQIQLLDFCTVGNPFKFSYTNATYQMFIKSNCLRILLVDCNFPDSIILDTIFLPQYSKEAPPRASSLLLHIFSYCFPSVLSSLPKHQQIQSYKYQSHSHGSKCLRLQDSSIHDSQFVSVRITEIVFRAARPEWLHEDLCPFHA